MTKTQNKMKITGLLLALVMMVSLLGAFSLTASAAAGVYASGTLGQYDRTAWTIYDSGLLVIDGKGNTMTSEKWDSTTASPWKDYADIITKVTFVNCQNWKSLPAHSFKSLYNLKEITLPENLETIQQLALGYTGIETIELPQSLTTIGEQAFSNCKSLNYVNIHNGVTTIYAYAFSECDNLKAISIPDTVTLMKGNVFAGCDNLEYVRLGSGSSELPGSAFSGCNLLENLTIPSNVTTIGVKFLANNASLKGVYYQGTVVPTTYAPNGTSGTFYGIDKAVPIYTHTTYESDTIGIKSQYLNDVRNVTKIDGYFVNMAHSVGGAFKVDKSIVAVGDTVTVDIMAYKNYALDTFAVKDADGNEITVNGDGNARTFAMPAGDVTITATFKSTIVPHVHSWSFEVDGTRINATCANSDSMCHNPNQSVVMTAPGTKYFAWNLERTVTVSGTVEDVEVSDVVYTLKSTGEVARPFAPGVYVATITVGGVAVTCEYEITKSDQLNYTFFTYTAPENLTYDGTAKVATAVLSEDVAPYIGDIEVLYNGSKEPPVNKGEYAVTINVAESDYYAAKSGIVLKTGSGKQMKDAKFTIAAKDVADLTYVLEDSYPLIDGNATPDVTIQYNGMTLVKDIDYTIAYENNTAPGTATMTITGIGNYTGTKTLNFNIVETHTHTEILHVEAVAPSCHEAGNPEYWYCEECGQAWIDEELTVTSNIMDVVILPYHDNNLEHHPAVDPIDCAHPGNIEYWYCPSCYEHFGDSFGNYYLNPWFIEITLDCVRPEGEPDCKTVACETCGNEIYGYGEHNVLLCQGGACTKCGENVEGYGCANYDTPACMDGLCYYCGGFVAGYGHENGSWADCCDGECAYGCGKQYPATLEHNDADGDDYCDECWNHLNHTFDINGFDPSLGGYCDVCWDWVDAPSPSLSFQLYGQQLNIGDDLSMKYYVSISGDGVDTELLKMKFIFLGTETVVDGVYDDETGMYVFTLEGINPQCMGDEIDAYLLYDGEEKASLLDYTVEKNLNDLLDLYDEDAFLEILVNDILAYGTAAGEYKGHNSMTDVYIGSDREIPDTTVSPSGAFTGYTVVFGQVNHLKIRVNLEEGQRLYLDGTDVTEELVDGIYKTSGIAPNNFAKKFSFEIKNGETSVQTFAVSVNDYISAQKNSETMGALVKALYNYGVSAETYNHAKTGNGEHSYAYTDNGDGTHDYCCTICSYVASESHDHTNGKCVCGKKATPTYTLPTGVVAYYGQTLADVALPEGFAWQDEATTEVGDLGSRTFKVTYTPADTDSYEAVTDLEITITVEEPPIVVMNEEEFVAAVAEGGNIKLGADITVTTIPFGINETITLDLNGKTLTGYFNIKSSGNVTINDSVGGGCINGATSSSYGGAIAFDVLGKLILNSGTIKSQVDNYPWCMCVNIVGGTFTMNGGKLVGNECVYLNPLTSTFEMTGGEIYATFKNESPKGTITLTGGTFNMDPSACVNEETHTVIDNGDGTWTIQEK